MGRQERRVGDRPARRWLAGASAGYLLDRGVLLALGYGIGLAAGLVLFAAG
jgi:hypothetical protein